MSLLVFFVFVFTLLCSLSHVTADACGNSIHSLQCQCIMRLPLQWTSGTAVQLADIPLPQSARLRSFASLTLNVSSRIFQICSVAHAPCQGDGQEQRPMFTEMFDKIFRLAASSIFIMPRLKAGCRSVDSQRKIIL